MTNNATDQWVGMRFGLLGAPRHLCSKFQEPGEGVSEGGPSKIVRERSRRFSDQSRMPQTGDIEQKNAVQPLSRGSRFWVHRGFEFRKRFFW